MEMWFQPTSIVSSTEYVYTYNLDDTIYIGSLHSIYANTVNTACKESVYVLTAVVAGILTKISGRGEKTRSQNISFIWVVHLDYSNEVEIIWWK